MKKSTAENLKGSLPSFLSNLSGYLKSLVSTDNTKELIANASGTLGCLIQLFGKPLIDRHFDKVEEARLKDFGFETYCNAAFVQAANSLVYVKAQLGEDLPLLEAALGIEKDFHDSIDVLERKLSVQVFQPKYHPAIQLVKKLVIDMLERLVKEKSVVNSFKLHFNTNIPKTVELAFGDSYSKHKAKIENLLFDENETKLLLSTISNSKIGFAENEDLKYEEAYGIWAPVTRRNGFDEFYSIHQVEIFEKGLIQIDNLIEEYFAIDPENHIDKILFIVADFGKGKSVFLKRYAATLAQKYIETGDGYIPIYFNLRSFANYSSDTPYGIIEDYLQTDYAIKVNSEHFKSKHYFFLIDSLDESCDLSKSAVEKVINSVKRIQNLDKTTIRTNKIIITSRPFDEVLFNYISINRPYSIKNERNKDIPQYISLYGFKKDQFNDWIYNSLRSSIPAINVSEENSFMYEVVKSLKSNEKPDIYSILLSTRTLSSSELRRPIFAYMIYQLLINNINVTKVGKIGIYLSFLNLLTKEAKYINDPDLKINLQEQFEARNILHNISALWLYEKQKGRQGSLKKADICRMVGSYSINESDIEVLEKYKSSGHSDIQFLSHSYFGENNNVLHFQHQSFAEVLLAEYYLKVLIKCSLDRPIDVDFVMTRLNIGKPTDQVINFFMELISLLRDTVSEEPSPELYEKRRLLTPLLASIAIDANNRSLNSQRLYFQWYISGQIDKETNEIPNTLLLNWAITDDVLNSITWLCEEIINSDKTFVLSKSVSITPLIDNEITHLLNNEYYKNVHIEKYLALTAGNALSNRKGDFFIRRFSPKKVLFLLKNAKYEWVKSAFIGMHLELSSEHEYLIGDILENHQIVGFNFSYSTFKNIIFFRCYLQRNLFENCFFENVAMLNTTISNNEFGGSNFTGVLDLSTCLFEEFGTLPRELLYKITKRAYDKFTDGRMIDFMTHRSLDLVSNGIKFVSLESIDELFTKIAFYLKYSLENGLISELEILQHFQVKKANFKARIESIISEISQTGFFKERQGEEIIKDGLSL